MKSVFIAAIIAVAAVRSARAADLPVKAPAPEPVAYNWSGCYLGIEGGGNWGRSSETDAISPGNPALVGLPVTGDFNLRGALFGGTLGCNYQVGTWVFGVENDFSWTNKSGSANDVPPFTTTAVNQLSEKWIDTLRGRIGIAWDRALFYGTGGAAFANTTLSVCGQVLCVNDSQTRPGWVAGIGVEYALWQSLSVKIEYLHADFGSRLYVDPPVVTPRGGTFVTRDVRLTDDIVRAGLNWRFNWGGPIVARY
jgi:outer membrane immunogenic protein